MAKIKRILVLNRGEIACRIIQASQELGMEAIAVYSDVDSGMRHCSLADKAIALGGTTPQESYLNIEKLVKIAKMEKCDAAHPGYGFLSERANAAEAFAKAGIIWIGPQPESIRLLGDKLGAKKILDKYKVPTLPWGEVDPKDKKSLATLAKKIGFPVLLKAASGGGGKGMRLVKEEKDLSDAAEAAAREAAASFGDATLLMEKYLEEPRHIEVQILGDSKGTVIHFGERECSMQRRHQKVIEEAPAANLKASSREAICESAVRLCAAAKYENAGTVEFLVDKKENFYFLEVNSRLQVEHSVTEAVWGIDLVKSQILIAQGAKIAELFPERTKMQARGHAMEARIYAEDAAKQFAPCPGTLTKISWPMGTNIRVDAGILENGKVTVDYDAMIAKITAWGDCRESARERLLWALRNTILFGTITNLNYLQDILERPEFIDGKFHVKFLETKMRDWKSEVPKEILDNLVSILAEAKNTSPNLIASSATQLPSPWESR